MHNYECHVQPAVLLISHTPWWTAIQRLFTNSGVKELMQHSEGNSTGEFTINAPKLVMQHSEGMYHPVSNSSVTHPECVKAAQ
jgi:hypothetical protein